MNVLKRVKHVMKTAPFDKSNNGIHKREKQQFKALLKQDGIDKIKGRFRIFEQFLKIENHVSFDSFTALLKSKGIAYDIDFVTDTMDLLVKYGFAEIKTFDDGIQRYEHRHIGHHHDHMICTKCGKIIEFSDEHLEQIQIQVASIYGFQMLRHNMELYGICKKCRKDQSGTIPLAMAREGETLIINGYDGGPTFNMRLTNMGLKVGDTVEVITNSGRGQMIVAVHDNRFMLGQGMSQKILVEPA